MQVGLYSHARLMQVHTCKLTSTRNRSGKSDVASEQCHIPLSILYYNIYVLGRLLHVYILDLVDFNCGLEIIFGDATSYVYMFCVNQAISLASSFLSSQPPVSSNFWWCNDRYSIATKIQTHGFYFSSCAAFTYVSMWF